MVVAVVGEVVVAMVNIRLCSWNLAYGQHGTRDRGRNESMSGISTCETELTD
jgi:hypothetical protein